MLGNNKIGQADYAPEGNFGGDFLKMRVGSRYRVSRSGGPTSLQGSVGSWQRPP